MDINNYDIRTYERYYNHFISIQPTVLLVEPQIQYATSWHLPFCRMRLQRNNTTINVAPIYLNLDHFA